MSEAGRLAVVMGGAMGIGEAIVRRFAAEGYRVAIIDRDIATARTLLGKLNLGGRITAHAADIALQPEVERAIAEVRQSHPDVPIMAAVNSAGIFHIRGRLFETTAEEFRQIFDVNVVGAFYFSRAVEPFLGQGACLIHIGSINGTHAGSSLTAYKASKAALHMMTRCIARELASDPRRIRANVVAPGWVDTPGERRVVAAKGTPDMLDDPEIARGTPLQRLTKAGEIADAVYFLCSEQASAITGQVLHVDGGLTA